MAAAITEQRQQQMEAIRQQLKESGVIGKVVNDFVPRLQLSVLFGDKRISLGDHVWPADVQRKPDSLKIHYENLEIMNDAKNSRLILVMTEPKGYCESLHWLLTNFVYPRRRTVPRQPEDIDLKRKSHIRATYQPPGPDAHMVVFTLFKKNESHITQPYSRDIFSTRAFAGINELGSPLGAAFCYIKNASESHNDESEFASTSNAAIDHESGNQNDESKLDLRLATPQICSKRNKNE